MFSSTSDNPTLKESFFDKAASSDQLTVEGVTNRVAVMLVFLIAAALPGWHLGTTAMAGPAIFGAAILGLGIAFAVIYAPKYAYLTAPVYALVEGVFVGGFSGLLEARYPGIAIQAVLLTIGVFVMMLTVYRTGLIEVTPSFRAGVTLATGAIFLVYLTSLIGQFVFGAAIPMIHEAGWVGIGFSLVVVGVASLNLLLDFDFIQRLEEKGADRSYEWLAAFGLIVTLVWLYIEILILLSKLRR